MNALCLGTWEYYSSAGKGRVALPNRMSFQKSSKGGGIFNPKMPKTDTLDALDAAMTTILTTNEKNALNML